MAMKELDAGRASSLEVGRTVVVNVRREDCDVYVGRPHPKAPKGKFPPIPLGNPIKQAPDADPFIRWFLTKLLEDKEFRAQMDTLNGKRLGCWCYPKWCHAMIYTVWCNCTKSEQRRILKLARESMDRAVRVMSQNAVDLWGE